ncbi:MAG: DNA-binding transcriptional regulator [Kiritimatiellae bacterium]|nr:DNA-binding transcriptional regulator [Kiritimatiellia bacterium]
MRSKARFDIAVSVEHLRAWGRRICEGIAEYLHGRPEWHLSMFEDGLPDAATLRRFDGFLWCIADERTANALKSTAKPVVSLFDEEVCAGIACVGSDHEACGQLAARTFIAHQFRNFAFFGWKGLSFSCLRMQPYIRTLEEEHLECHVYLSNKLSMSRYVDRHVRRERLALPPDAQAVGQWVERLPRPVGVFCANDLRAWQLAEICRTIGLKVPKDVAILGADNDEVPCLFSNVTLSSVDTDLVETGRLAAGLLDDMISGREATCDRRILVKPSGVVDRESTAVYPVDPPWLADVLVYIRANIGKALTAEDVVAYVGKSYGTIENAFKRVLGTTVQREIMSARIAAAEHLLRTTALPVSAVADRTGFKSPQYFSHCFADCHDISPGEWRRRK